MRPCTTRGMFLRLGGETSAPLVPCLVLIVLTASVAAAGSPRRLRRGAEPPGRQRARGRLPGRGHRLRSSRPSSDWPRPPTCARRREHRRRDDARARLHDLHRRRPAPTAPSTIRSEQPGLATRTARSGSSRTSTRASVDVPPPTRPLRRRCARRPTPSASARSSPARPRDRLAGHPGAGRSYTLRYIVAAGLDGKAKAVTADGGEVKGEFVVKITDVPPKTGQRRGQGRHRSATERAPRRHVRAALRPSPALAAGARCSPAAATSDEPDRRRSDDDAADHAPATRAGERRRPRPATATAASS